MHASGNRLARHTIYKSYLTNISLVDGHILVSHLGHGEYKKETYTSFFAITHCKTHFEFYLI